jgi:protein farnesyltransferase subunit beta
VVATLLDILTPELVKNTAGFIASCQTYEGGFSSASQPFYAPTGDVLPYPRPPLGEAHGGYTSCAVASWIMLKQAGFLEGEHAEINIPRLLRWLVHLQGLPVEMGGFRGRTNKLVDGCYSWWVGGTFGLLEALGTPSHHPGRTETPPEGETEEDWEDCEDTLFDRTALQNYILFAAQTEAGLRDKPKK